MVSEQAIQNPTLSTGGVHAARETIVASHQPNYLPWLGYFYKIAHVHKFVFVDMVMFPSSGFVNRNSIKSKEGAIWLTIPVRRSGRHGQLINEVETDNVQPWVRRHLSFLRCNYARAPYYAQISARLGPHYEGVFGSASSLSEFNIGLIREISDYLGLETEWLRASQLGVKGPKTDLVVDICKNVGATTYFSGTGAKAYLEQDKLKDAGVDLYYSPFSPRHYPQLFGEFVGNLSIVDVLMNCGRTGTRRLLGIDPERG